MICEYTHTCLNPLSYSLLFCTNVNYYRRRVAALVVNLLVFERPRLVAKLSACTQWSRSSHTQWSHIFNSFPAQTKFKPPAALLACCRTSPSPHAVTLCHHPRLGPPSAVISRSTAAAPLIVALVITVTACLQWPPPPSITVVTLDLCFD
jgi:hypothetical protein